MSSCFSGHVIVRDNKDAKMTVSGLSDKLYMEGSSSVRCRAGGCGLISAGASPIIPVSDPQNRAGGGTHIRLQVSPGRRQDPVQLWLQEMPEDPQLRGHALGPCCLSVTLSSLTTHTSPFHTLHFLQLHCTPRCSCNFNFPFTSTT